MLPCACAWCDAIADSPLSDRDCTASVRRVTLCRALHGHTHFVTAERRHVTTPTFFQWLCAQTHRSDDIGTLAQHAIKDKLFPRSARHLYLFLLRYDGLPALRSAVKKAHAEYRRERAS